MNCTIYTIVSEACKGRTLMKLLYVRSLPLLLLSGSVEPAHQTHQVRPRLRQRIEQKATQLILQHELKLSWTQTAFLLQLFASAFCSSGTCSTARLRNIPSHAITLLNIICCFHVVECAGCMLQHLAGAAIKACCHLPFRKQVQATVIESRFS